MINMKVLIQCWSSVQEQARHLLVRQPIRKPSVHVRPNQVNKWTSSKHFNEAFARSLFGLLYNRFFLFFFFFFYKTFIFVITAKEMPVLLSTLSCFCFFEGGKEEIWQGNWEVLYISGKTSEFVLKKERVLFTRGNIS